MDRNGVRSAVYIDESGLLMLAVSAERSRPWADLCERLLSETGHGLATSDHALLCVCRFLESRCPPNVVRSFLSDSEPFLEEVTPVRMADLIRATDIAEEHGLQFRLAVNVAVAYQRGFEGLISPEEDYDRIKALRRLRP